MYVLNQDDALSRLSMSHLLLNYLKFGLWIHSIYEERRYLQANLLSRFQKSIKIESSKHFFEI